MVSQIITEKLICPYNLSLYDYTSGLIKYKGRLYVGSAFGMRKRSKKYMHASTIGGHSGREVTFHRFHTIFWWPTLREDVLKFVSEYHVCQLNKHELIKSTSLLQPLLVPERAWEDISMDFIEQLPKSKGFDTILVIVDTLTKYSHFNILYHPYIASQLAHIFLNSVYKLYGLPSTILSDKNQFSLAISGRSCSNLWGFSSS